MELHRKKIFLPLLFFVFLSCYPQKEQFCIQPVWIKDDLPQSTVDSAYMSFFLNEPSYLGEPIVKIVIDDTPYFFLLDSGSNCNLFNSEELLEGFIGLFDERDTPKIRYNSVVGSSVLNVDGVLGMPFLRMGHKNVVFNYRKQTVSFDQPPISKNELIPVSLWTGLWFVEFTADDITEYGLLDTGGSNLVLRTDFGKTSPYSSVAEIKSYLFSDEDVVQKHYEDVYVKQFTFGGETRKKMQYLPADSDQIVALPVARRFLQIFNNLGATVFKDHVIQFDFENNVFRIK